MPLEALWMFRIAARNSDRTRKLTALCDAFEKLRDVAAQGYQFQTGNI